MWAKLGIATALLVTAAAPYAFQAGRAEPARPFPDARPAAGDRRFTAICKTGEIADIRPDPAWLSASFDDDDCRAPRLPAPLNGFVATRKQIVAGMAAAKNYAAQSDQFQKCVGDFLAARKAAAGRGGRPLGTALVAIESHRIAVSEKDKQLARARIEVAINAFNEYGSDCPDH